MNDKVESREIAVAQPYRPVVASEHPKAIVPSDFASVYRFAELIAESGMAPKDMKTPAAIATVILHGLEIGMTPMAALQSIAVINGRVSLWGDGALALVRGSGQLEVLDESYEGEFPKDDFTAVCKIKRKGQPEVISRFSIADAKMANLWNKVGPWKDYPKRMLKMRARSWPMRDEFTDIMRGMAVAEEVRDHSDTYDGVVDDTPPKPPADAITDETATDTAPKRRGRPAGKRSSVAEEASKGTVVDHEAANEQSDPPTPADDDPPKPEETAKPADAAKPAEQAKGEPEKPKDAPKPKEVVKEQAKPADAPAASPAKKTPGQELSGMIPTWGELGEKMQATLKDMHTAMYQSSEEGTLRGVWSKFFGGFTPSSDADLKAKQDAAMKLVRNFHKDRIAKAAEPPAEEQPPAPEADDPPTPEDEDARFDIDGFRRELDGAMSGQTTPAGVNRTYSEFMEVPRREGLINDDQFEEVFQPMLQEHLLRVDDFDK